MESFWRNLDLGQVPRPCRDPVSEVGGVLKAFGLAGKTVFIGHEITRATVELLRARIMTLVIDQNPELHARRSLQILLYALGYSDVAPPPPSIPFSIVTPENVDLYAQLSGLPESFQVAM